ncbi:MAG: hypothetical protein HC829_07390 [Bacteroidales bacterium]|nr:hypothetical protein [Bacteroidales bacterium]
MRRCRTPASRRRRAGVPARARRPPHLAEPALPLRQPLFRPQFRCGGRGRLPRRRRLRRICRRSRRRGGAAHRRGRHRRHLLRCHGIRPAGAGRALDHARATDRSINDTLNKRLDRTEFMPFAPVVRIERYAEVFELPQSLVYPAQFMTTTCDVKPGWRDRVPAVTHVDGTARPQVIARGQNRVYWDILDEYEKLTGLPVLINTSFNVHEEPIINAPAECIRALKDKRVDLVVTQSAIWSFAG